MSDKFTLRVMLLGGRRIGKTTILASMYNCIKNNNFFSDTPFIYNPDNFTSEEALVAKANELKKYFINASKNENFSTDDIPTEGDITYSYVLKLKNKEKSEIGIEYYDYPGEWLTKEEKYEKMKEEIKKSHILVIVLDTPYLMEEDGYYNEDRNHCYLITTKVMGSFIGTTNNEFIKDKMVLFLPIKCEYKAEKGDISKVTDSVKREYESLISSLKDCNCTIAILPILTLGTALFTDFERDSKDKLIFVKDESGKEMYPKALYYFSKRATEIAIEKKLNYKYSDDPKYCEQPLLYIVLFAIKMYIKIKGEKTNKISSNVFSNKISSNLFSIFLREFGGLLGQIISNLFTTTFLKWATVEDFIKNKSVIEEKIKVSGDGFEIISDPLHIF